MAKCPYCGNDVFSAHQICHLDVLVDPDGKFLENDSADGFADTAIYEGETPFGPYTCTHCGAEFEDLQTMKVSSEPSGSDCQPFLLISEENGTKTYVAAETSYLVHITYHNGKVNSLYAEPPGEDLLPLVSSEQDGKLVLHLMTASKQYAAVDKMIRQADPDMKKVAKILCASTRAMNEIQAFFLGNP